MNEHKAFHRPTTLVNKVVDATWSRLLRPRQRIDIAKLEKWRDSSFRVFRGIVSNQEALDRIMQEPEWIISAGKSYDNIWFGEATFNEKEIPKVIIFEDSPSTRLPKNIFEIVAQAGVDHMFGHLYPFYSGEADYGETAACRYQFLAARARGGFVWNSAAFTAALIYRFHKGIPLSNY